MRKYTVYLCCIIKGSSNIIMGYKYKPNYISLSLFTNLLFFCSQIIFSHQDFLTRHTSRFYKKISLFEKILKYQYFWFKNVFYRHNSNIIYMNMILICVFYMRKTWYDKQREREFKHNLSLGKMKYLVPLLTKLLDFHVHSIFSCKFLFV